MCIITCLDPSFFILLEHPWSFLILLDLSWSFFILLYHSWYFLIFLDLSCSFLILLYHSWSSLIPLVLSWSGMDMRSLHSRQLLQGRKMLGLRSRSSHGQTNDGGERSTEQSGDQSIVDQRRFRPPFQWQETSSPETRGAWQTRLIEIWGSDKNAKNAPRTMNQIFLESGR